MVGRVGRVEARTGSTRRHSQPRRRRSRGYWQRLPSRRTLESYTVDASGWITRPVTPLKEVPLISAVAAAPTASPWRMIVPATVTVTSASKGMENRSAAAAARTPPPFGAPEEVAVAVPTASPTSHAVVAPPNRTCTAPEMRYLPGVRDAVVRMVAGDPVVSETVESE